MDLVLSAVKADLDSVLSAGRYMLASFFVMAVFFNYMGLLSRSVNWADIIVRLVIGLVLLQNYTWVMDTTRNIVIDVDAMITPNHSDISQYATMNDNFHKQHQEQTRPGIIDQVKYIFFTAPMHNIIVNLSFLFYGVISKVMEAVRYSFIAILYKLGPALIPLIMFQSCTNVVKGWFTNYVSILCWPILWHIALSVAVSLSANAPSIEQFACINFAVGFVLVFSPLIINGFVSGVGASSSTVLAGFVASKAAVGFMAGAGQVGLAVGGAKLVQPIVDRFFGNKSPTTTAGKFKDAMLGNKEKGAKS